MRHENFEQVIQRGIQRRKAAQDRELSLWVERLRKDGRPICFRLLGLNVSERDAARFAGTEREMRQLENFS